MMKPIVILSGGGIQGAACAAQAAAEHELILLHVDLGDPASPTEVESLQALAPQYPAATVVRTKLSDFDGGESPVIKRRAAAAVEAVAGGGSAGVVRPGLLSVLASLAIQCAIRYKARRVLVGLSEHVDATHLGLSVSKDRSDQFREWLYFFNAMTAASVPGREPIVVEAPLSDMTYTDIVKLAFHYQVPFEHTRTCRTALAKPCGRCPACRARAAAFAEACLADPLVEVMSV